MTPPEDFDWADVAEQMVQQEVQQVAIYDNENGDVVIRQRQWWDEERDTIIVIARGNVEAVIAAMRAAVGQPAETTPKVPLSAAERQRRYRDKHRNGSSDEERHGGDALLLLQVNGDQDPEELAG
jgi:hypothetical protein